MGRITTLSAVLLNISFLFLPSSLSPPLCISVCIWMLQALQRWPAAMLHTVVLVKKAGAVPGASPWQTEQMPYTNKQPGGVWAASPSILHCYVNSKLLRFAAAAAKTLCPHHSLPQPARKATQRVTYFYLPVVSWCLCHLQLCSFIWLYFRSWAKGYCEYAACIYLHKGTIVRSLSRHLS